MPNQSDVITSLKEDDENLSSFAAITNYPNPVTTSFHEIPEDEKIALIEEKFRDIMVILGLDITNESLQRTPYRIAKMYVKEIFNGLNVNNFPEISLVKDQFHDDDPNMVLVSNIEFNSFCEHHFVPFQGKAHVAYIPNGHVIGLSKINRIVNYFAKRPQIQERLTAQIADSLATILQTENVAVSLTAKHACVSSRGIQDQSSMTTTNFLRGHFKNAEHLRKEFFEGIR
ncbi:MAG: GTP cyclohydrolase I [Chlamydiales bacterium]|jgi:GTP cyclohydrolase I